MPAIVEFSIVPIGKGTSLSKFLVPVIKILEKRGVKYKLTPMCTIFEVEGLNEAFELIRESHEAVFKEGVERVVTSIKIDDRRDIERSMDDKITSLMSKL